MSDEAKAIGGVLPDSSGVYRYGDGSSLYQSEHNKHLWVPVRPDGCHVQDGRGRTRFGLSAEGAYEVLTWNGFGKAKEPAPLPVATGEEISQSGIASSFGHAETPNERRLARELAEARADTLRAESALLPVTVELIRLRKIETLLRESEWKAERHYCGNTDNICLFCGEREEEGHSSDCRFLAAIQPTTDAEEPAP